MGVAATMRRRAGEAPRRSGPSAAASASTAGARAAASLARAARRGTCSYGTVSRGRARGGAQGGHSFPHRAPELRSPPLPPLSAAAPGSGDDDDGDDEGAAGAGRGAWPIRARSNSCCGPALRAPVRVSRRAGRAGQVARRPVSAWPPSLSHPVLSPPLSALSRSIIWLRR